MTEPTDEPSQKTSDTFRPQEPEQPSAKRARRGLIVGVSGLTVLVMLFALLFAAFNHRSIVSGGPPPTAQAPTPTPTQAINWQRYTDPDGHFTISIPKGWTALRQSSILNVGDSRGSVTFHETIDDFGDPPIGQNTITISILVWPIENARQHQWMCDAFPPMPGNATLAGLPADGPGKTWLLNSSGAHFQIDYVYPNDPGDILNPPPPTPMPPGFYEKGQQEWHTILASFMPMPDTPLKCP